MAKHTGLLDRIWAVCDAADDSLTSRAIIDAIRAQDEPSPSAPTIRQAIYEAEHSGRLIRCEIRNQVTWTTHPTWESKSRPSTTTATDQAERAPPAIAAESVPAASPPQAGTASAAVVTSPPAMPKTRTPFALRERIGAIAQDLEDALADACKAELSHPLIQHLVAANNAAHRAALALRD